MNIISDIVIVFLPLAFSLLIIVIGARVLHELRECLELSFRVTGQCDGHSGDILFTHGTDRLVFKKSLEVRVYCGEFAGGTRTPLLDYHVLARSNTEGDVVLAARTIKACLWDVESAIRTRTYTLGVIFLLYWLSCYRFYLFLKGWRNLTSVLWSN